MFCCLLVKLALSESLPISYGQTVQLSVDANKLLIPISPNAFIGRIDGKEYFGSTNYKAIYFKTKWTISITGISHNIKTFQYIIYNYYQKCTSTRIIVNPPNGHWGKVAEKYIGNRNYTFRSGNIFCFYFAWNPGVTYTFNFATKKTDSILFYSTNPSASYNHGYNFLKHTGSRNGVRASEAMSIIFDQKSGIGIGQASYSLTTTGNPGNYYDYSMSNNNIGSYSMNIEKPKSKGRKKAGGVTFLALVIYTIIGIILCCCQGQDEIYVVHAKRNKLTKTMKIKYVKHYY